jgi:membrane protein DedA with SNARE-associated domain/uncharacterized tellurite resistance protein B-like protein
VKAWRSSRSSSWRRADLIESLLNWLAGLPPIAVYGVLALLAFLENIVPPVPADTAVALGAFLTHRGVTSLPLVYAVTLTSNLAGAAGVYWAARRYGRRLFATRAGRRLLSPEALAVVEREYLRFGVLGIVIGRWLPGIRAVVPPFAGLANLGVGRALIPISLASAVWYAAIALIGAAIGAEWPRIVTLMTQLNHTLAIVAVVLVVGTVVLLWRQRRKGGRLWQALRRAMPGSEGEQRSAPETMSTAALALLEVAYADRSLDSGERAGIERELRARWNLPALPERAPADEREWNGVGRRLLAEFGARRRRLLVEQLWSVAFATTESTSVRSRLLRNAAALLGLSPDEIVEAEAAVQRDKASLQ